MKCQGIIFRKFGNVFKKMWKKLTFLGKSAQKICQNRGINISKIFQNQKVIYEVKISVPTKEFQNRGLFQNRVFTVILTLEVVFTGVSNENNQNKINK